MTTLRTRIRVDAARRVVVQLPDDVLPGDYDVTVIVDEVPVADRPRLGFPVDDAGPWPGGLDLSRAALYGDDGR